jgi:hypothetical protein
MATNFPQYQAASQPDAFTPQPFNLEQDAPELVQALAAINARSQTRPSGITPEQASKRRAQNDLDTQFGMLMQLTGNEAAGGIGASVLKKALAARTPQITEKGWANPETGEFTYDPDYLQRQDEEDRQRILSHIASARTNKQSQQDAATNRRFESTERAKDRMALEQYKLENKPPTLVPLMGPDGQVHYGPKVEGATPAALPSAGQPSEGERKAATLLGQMRVAQKQLAEATAANPEAAVPTATVSMLQGAGDLGHKAATYVMSPTRQRIENSQIAILDNALTLGTGASYTKEQLRGYALSLFPQPGETDPKVLSDKAERLQGVLRAAEIAAGRSLAQVNQAAPQAPHAASAASAPGPRASSPQDPFGILGP